jgi:urease accessory protein
VRARAALTAEADATGRTRLTLVRSEAPLVLRPTADAVYLAAGAAGPVGGDDLDLTVTVGPGACLTLRTVAATVVLPGPPAGSPPAASPGPCESVFRLTASVGAGGRLAILPEPTVVAANAHHRVTSTVEVAAGGALVLREEVILGRHGETGGTYRGLSHVDVAGAPLLRHELVLDGADPAAVGPAAAVGARACGSLLVVHPAWDLVHRPAGYVGPGVAAMPLAGPGLLVAAIADDARTLRARLATRHRGG